MERFELFDHTADIGLRAFGSDMRELFANAAYGMFSILADLQSVEAKVTHMFDVRASDVKELLVAWLNELLYTYEVRELIFKEFEILRLSNTNLVANALGEPIDITRHIIKAEIKTATYHKVTIGKVPVLSGGDRAAGDRYVAEVILDV
ncbi:MAG: archease [bacterium]